MIPHEYVQEVVRRNDITEVVGQYVQLRRRGRLYSGLCPFHNEKTPSFYVYPETQSYYCFGCGAGGDVINFVRKISNLSYVEAVKQLAGQVGMPLPEEEDQESKLRSRLLEINRCAARYFFDQLNAPTPEANVARGYWRQKRGLSDAAIRRFGLGYAPENFSGLLHYLRRRGFSEPELEASGLVKRSAKGNLYDIFRHRVMVPIIDVRGNIIAFGGRVMDDSKPKYINSPETMIYKKSPHAVCPQCGQKVRLPAVHPLRGVHGCDQHARGRVRHGGVRLRHRPDLRAGQAAHGVRRRGGAQLRLGRGGPEGHRAQPGPVCRHQPAA